MQSQMCIGTRKLEKRFNILKIQPYLSGPSHPFCVLLTGAKRGEHEAILPEHSVVWNAGEPQIL